MNIESQYLVALVIGACMLIYYCWVLRTERDRYMNIVDAKLADRPKNISDNKENSAQQYSPVTFDNV